MFIWNYITWLICRIWGIVLTYLLVWLLDPAENIKSYLKFLFYPFSKDNSGMNLINEWGRACTVSCDAIGMLMVSSSVSASLSIDSAVFQMSQCLAKIQIVIENRWSCLRTKQSWCKLIEGWSWKKWSLSRWMPSYTHSYLWFPVSRGNMEGIYSFAAKQKFEEQ